MDVRFCEGRNHHREAHVRATGSDRFNSARPSEARVRRIFLSLTKDLHGRRLTGSYQMGTVLSLIPFPPDNRIRKDHQQWSTKLRSGCGCDWAHPESDGSRQSHGCCAKLLVAAQAALNSDLLPGLSVTDACLIFSPDRNGADHSPRSSMTS